MFAPHMLAMVCLVYLRLLYPTAFVQSALNHPARIATAIMSSSADANGRPAKMPRIESRGGGALSARDKFLQELAKYASDDDDEDGSGSGPGLNGGLGQPSLLATATEPEPPTSFFGGDDQPEEEAVTASQAAPQQRNIGLSLLRGMHHSLVGGDPAPRPMAKVESYAPLSSGGFLDTDADHGDTKNVKIGDVMVALKLPNAPKSGSSSCSKPGSPVTASGPGSPPPQAEAQRYYSPTTTAPVEKPAEVFAAAASNKILSHFRAEASMTEEERRYGRRLSVDMTTHLFSVSRLDRATHTLEGIFLDGSRAKLRLTEVRPAGFVERGLFAKWRADPASRPVKVIGAASAVSPQPPSSTASPASPTEQQQQQVPPAWWVLPNLVVRVVAADAGEWYGQKGVVVSIRRKENTVRLVPLDVWEQHHQRPPGSPLQPPPNRKPAAHVPMDSAVDLVGLDGIETVLPKKGESGMIVLGEHKGDMASVLARIRGEEGDLAAIEVSCQRTSDVLRLQPQDLCAMARR